MLTSDKLLVPAAGIELHSLRGIAADLQSIVVTSDAGSLPALTFAPQHWRIRHIAYAKI